VDEVKGSAPQGLARFDFELLVFQVTSTGGVKEAFAARTIMCGVVNLLDPCASIAFTHVLPAAEI